MSFQKEIRKWVIWYKWLYDVSNFWNIKCLSRIRSNWKSTYKTKEKIMKSKPSPIWYNIIALTKDWKSKYTTIHRVVVEAFIPNQENKRTVNHKNWIRNDNRLENLERATYSENNKHAYSNLNRKSSSFGAFLEESHHRTEVIQKSLDWKQINIRWCIKRASMELWIWYRCIVNNCSWRSKSAWWYRRLYLHKNKICS